MSDTIEATPKSLLSDAMKRHGITIAAKFVPFSQSRNAVPDKSGKVWRSLNWTITLRKGTRAILTTDYSAGEAHCPSYKQGARRTLDYVEALNYEIENGKEALANRGWSTMARPGAKTVEPDYTDVMQSLLMDADVLDHGCFEDWASNLGYDADSRAHEKIYAACLATALRLRNGLGEAAMAELSEAARDY